MLLPLLRKKDKIKKSPPPALVIPTGARNCVICQKITQKIMQPYYSTVPDKLQGADKNAGEPPDPDQRAAGP